MLWVNYGRILKIDIIEIILNKLFIPLFWTDRMIMEIEEINGDGF